MISSLAFLALLSILDQSSSFAPLSREHNGVAISTSTIKTTSNSPRPTHSLIVLGPYSNKPAPDWAPEELEFRSERFSLDISKTKYTSSVKVPRDAYFAMCEKGQANAQLRKHDIFLQSFLGGSFVGFGCLLSLAIAGNSGGIAINNPGIAKAIFGAVFPINLILVLTSGAQLFSGNAATAPAAYYEGLIDARDVGRSLFMSLLANIAGCVVLAFLASYAGLLKGGAAALCRELALGKVSYSLGQTFVKAFLCNWMVAMAVFLAGASNDMTGKILSIWFPVFAFVSIGLEHSVANLFLLPAALITKAPITLSQVIFKNLIPVIAGNFVAGSGIVAALYSYQFGKLGAKNRTVLQKRLVQKEKERIQMIKESS